MKFSNKIVLVTGSSRGIGRSVAIAFAKKGANVIINYHSNDIEAEIVKEVIESYNVKCLTIKADLSKSNEVKNMVKTIIDEFGRIDILVNNAGIVTDMPFSERKAKHWTDTMNVNLIGMFLVSKEVSKYMLKENKGNIINISSTSGMDVISPESIDYDASKAGVISLTKNLALQLSPCVNVNSVAPGWVDTEMNTLLPKEYLKQEREKIYLKRFAEPEEIANVVLFLASDEARYINGETIKVDGGM